MIKKIAIGISLFIFALFIIFINRVEIYNKIGEMKYNSLIKIKYENYNFNFYYHHSTTKEEALRIYGVHYGEPQEIKSLIVYLNDNKIGYQHYWKNGYIDYKVMELTEKLQRRIEKCIEDLEDKYIPFSYDGEAVYFHSFKGRTF